LAPERPATPDQQVDAERKVRELSLLFEISQILDRTLDLEQVFMPVLEAISKHMGMVHGTLSLVNRQTGEVRVAAGIGLSTKQQERGRYQIGEGVTGKVVETGQPAIVPRVSEEPLFLDRTGVREGLEREDISFLCVPIKLEGEVIGALSADRLFADGISFEEDVRLLAIIGSMIAQAVRLRQQAQEERERLLAETSRLRHELEERFRPANIIGRSKAMQAVYDLVAQVAKSSATVLLRGESGVGKELVAHAIHYSSPRAAKPFVRVNIGALPETVVESELFGHEKGAFTGAVAQRKGDFELADGGTIFLDEIGDLSANTQILLLRVLQEKEYRRVGSSTPLKTDARVIAATNRDLEELVERGEFRQDLYYRLNVFPIHVPPLRERKTDIPLLTDHFVEKYNKAHGKRVRRISTPAIDMLMSYHWPGNVRELENCIERAVLLTEDDVIHGHHLPPTLQTAEASGTTPASNLEAALGAVEREMILDALKSSRGNMAQAARSLGITERIMGLRVKKYGIEPGRFRT
jgi:Nif-specific regulatory protein